ncbi:MAG: DNA-binding protein [Candidatus Altiarchaeota archaeon]|nr:DNA-binding protein [Candidatus Altiarchaeota archaeon]
MKFKHFRTDGFYVGSFTYDSEALGGIKNLALKENISSGCFTVIGAVKDAVISFYDQKEKKYVERKLDQPMEIVSCMGNIAEKDGDIIVHAHACFSLEDGSTVGGHLVSMRIFAGELHLFPGDSKLERKFDAKTGLNLLDL